MADAQEPLTQEELDQRIADSPVGAQPFDADVSRATNLLGAARQGFLSSVVTPPAAIARLLGDKEAADRAAALLRDPNALGGGLVPTNPTMAEDFSTGVARGIGAAPMTALTAEVGLPALVGSGALSGYEAYKEQLADYEIRKASGQLQPGEEPPSPLKEIGKGAVSNAAFLLGGAGGGALARGVLPAIKGTLPRVATGYGATVAGNLVGEQAARLAEGRGLGYDNPAQLGESGVAAFGTFGIRPTQHLLADPRAKFGYKPPPKPAPSAATEVLDAHPDLALNPVGEAQVKATTPAPEPEPAPYTGPGSPEFRRNEAIYAFNPPRETDALAPAAADQLRENLLRQQQIAEQRAAIERQQALQNPSEPLAETPITAEVAPTAEQPTLPSNETRNEIQQVVEPGLSDGPNGALGNAADPGLQERGLVQGPDGLPQGPGLELRGQGEQRPEAPQRPVLTVPESPQTLIEQQKQLVAGTRPAMLFTEGETPLALPTGFSEVRGPSGVWHFNPELTSALKVKEADQAGRQNELLGLGPQNKADVAAAPGEPVVVTERTPEGVEVKAAAASPDQAPATAAELETQKTEGNVIDIEEPAQVLSRRRNETAVNGLHQEIGSLDQQIAQAQRTGFGEPTARRKPLPGEEAAAAREALRDLDAKRTDAMQRLSDFTPESEAPSTPLSGDQQRHAATGDELKGRLAETQAQLKAAEAVVDSLRPENAKPGVDENGNAVEVPPKGAADREALAEAKADASALRRAVEFLKRKVKENAETEPEEPQVIGAPRIHPDFPAEPFRPKAERNRDIVDSILANESLHGMKMQARKYGVPLKRAEKVEGKYIEAFQRAEDLGKEPPDEQRWAEKIRAAAEDDVMEWEKKEASIPQKAIEEDALENQRARQYGDMPIAAPADVTKMAERYKAEPAKVQAFVDNAEAKVMPKFEQQIRQVFGEGVTIVRNSDRVETIGVVPTRDGGVEIHIGPNYLSRTGAKFGEAGGAHLAKTLGEEGIHVAVLRAIKEMWQAAGSQGDFYVFTKGVMSRISNDILNTVKGLRDQGKHQEAHAIEEAIRNSKELYDGELENANSLTGRQILEQMAADPHVAFKYANELLRQFAQLRQNKQISETTYQKIARALTDLYRKAQASIKSLVGKAHEGELGKTAGDILRRVEELTKGEAPEGGKVRTPRLEESSVKGVRSLEESVIPWHGGADDSNARTNSRDVPGYSPREAASDFLADSRTASEGSLEPHERHTVELARLANFESQRGRLIDKSALIDGNPDVEGGGEHQVYLDPATQRWVKFTRPGATGLVSEKFQTDIPLPENLSKLSTRGASPTEYLERMRLGNEKLGDDQQYHGVWLDKDGEPGGLVISQPHVEGTESTRSEVSASLTKAGFKRVGIDTWYRPTDRVMIDDATPRNFVTKNGVATPIDVPIRVADDALHQEAMRQINSGQKFLKAGERKNLPFPPQPDNRQIIGAPRIVERVKETLEEKTRTYKYLWGKPRRQFVDNFFGRTSGIENHGDNQGGKETNSVYNQFAKAGLGEIKGVGEPSAELTKNLEAGFALREAGFGNATSEAEIQAARDKLSDFNRRIAAGLVSTDPNVKKAAEAMKPRYDRAQELVDSDLGKALSAANIVHQKTQSQVARQNAEGIPTATVDDYIRRLYEDNQVDNDLKYLPSSGNRGGYGYEKGFMRPRYFESAVDAMEAGKKIANFNVAQLIGHSEASIQKAIQMRHIEDELRQVNAPVTNLPVIADGITRENPISGKMETVAPNGYTRITGPSGRDIYVEQNVAPLFELLAAPSWVRQSALGRGLLRVAAGIKHGTLLLDTFHSARVAYNLAGLLAQNASPAELKRFIKKGLATLDIHEHELDDFVAHGIITAEDAQYARDNQAIYKRAEKSGTQFGKQLDNLYEQVGKPFWISVLNNIPLGKDKGGVGDLITDFNKWTFQKETRAAMLVGWKEARERNESRFGATKTEAEIDRITSKEINELFGNMGRQGLFKSRTAQDISRLFILAPQWNDGRIRFQGRAVGQSVRALGKLVTGHPEALGNASGVLLALAGGAFAANQVLNLATTGKPTWDNPDGHKLDAFIPGGKNGFYYSPLSLAAEDIHTIQKYGVTSTPLDTAKRIALNKASGITRAGAALAGIDTMGRPLAGDINRVTQAGKNLLPIPIFAAPAISPLLNPEFSQKGDFLRQGLGMAGIKIDRAEGPEQRFRQLGNKILPNQFPKSESRGDYSKLRSFVGNENVKDASKEILGLLAKGKTEDQIAKAFRVERPYTVSKQADALLMRNPTARQLLAPAQVNRQQDSATIRQAIALAKQSPKYSEAIIKGRKAKMPVEQ